MIETLIKILDEGNFSCVIANNGEKRIYTQRGVADLYFLLKNDSAFLHGATIADKVVGKAAAAIMVLGRVEELYAKVISQPALDLLAQTAIIVHYAQSVPFIYNRNKDGLCPLESTTMAEKTAEGVLKRIDVFLLKNENEKNRH